MSNVERLESLLQKTPLAELALLQHAEPSLRLVETTAFPPGSVGAAVQTGMYDNLVLRAGDNTHRLTHVRLWSAEVTDLTPARAAFAFLVIDDVRSVWPPLPLRLAPDSRYPLDGGFWLPAARLDTFAAAVTTNARDWDLPRAVLRSFVDRNAHLPIVDFVESELLLELGPTVAQAVVSGTSASLVWRAAKVMLGGDLDVPQSIAFEEHLHLTRDGKVLDTAQEQFRGRLDWSKITMTGLFLQDPARRAQLVATVRMKLAKELAKRCKLRSLEGVMPQNLELGDLGQLLLANLGDVPKAPKARRAVKTAR